MTGSQTDVDRVMAAFGTTPIPYRPSAPKSFKKATTESRSAAPLEGSRAARDIAALLAPAPAQSAPQAGEPGAGGAMSEVFPLIAFALPEAGDLYVAPANGARPQAPAPAAPKKVVAETRIAPSIAAPSVAEPVVAQAPEQAEASAAAPARQSFAWPPVPEPPAPEPPAPIVAAPVVAAPMPMPMPVAAPVAAPRQPAPPPQPAWPNYPQAAPGVTPYGMPPPGFVYPPSHYPPPGPGGWPQAVAPYPYPQPPAYGGYFPPPPAPPPVAEQPRSASPSLSDVFAALQRVPGPRRPDEPRR